MESNYYNEESINSNEEIDQQNNNIDLGIGRSYECVYCKRGFNTAQALGGHMNIHRKDRSKNKLPSNTYPNDSNNKQRVFQRLGSTSSNFYQQINIPAGSSSSYNHHHHHDLTVINHDHQTHNLYHHHHQEPLDPLISLRLEFSNTKNHLDMNNIRHDHHEVMNQKEELDLELRLGYHY